MARRIDETTGYRGSAGKPDTELAQIFRLAGARLARRAGEEKDPRHGAKRNSTHPISPIKAMNAARKMNFLQLNLIIFLTGRE
jgi:hypothetical protein